MADNDQIKNLPGEASNRLAGARNALEIADPITGFFHSVASRARTKALNQQTVETDAFARNMDAQAGAIKAMIELRDAVDDYRARDELADRFYENAKARAEKVLAQRDAQARTTAAEAEWNALEKEHSVEAKAKFKDLNFEIGEKRKQADIAEVVDITPTQSDAKPGTTPVQDGALAKLKAALDDARQARVQERASGKDNDQLDAALTAAEELLKAAGIKT